MNGSEWGWLAYNKQSGRLQINVGESNELMLDQSDHLVPLLSNKVWVDAQIVFNP